MPTLRSIMKPLATIKVPFGGETVSVTYRPQYLSPEFESELEALGNEGKATEAFCNLFCRAIASWDLTLEEGGPVIEVTPQAISPIPYEILGEILKKVQEASAPNPETEKNSVNTSQPADGSGPFPSGMD